jgi:hypothetical protein
VAEYSPETAARVNAAIDKALAPQRRKQPRQPSAGELAGQLGDALNRWPDAFGAGDRDMVSEIIYILDGIEEAR